MSNKKDYDQGIIDGYRYAVDKILAALNIKLNNTQPSDDDDDEEFYNMPRKR